MSEESETQNSQPSEGQSDPTEDTTATEENPTSLTGEPKGEGEEAAAEPAAPLAASDISFPEGLEVQDEIRDEFLEVLNNGEMSPKDRAQALIDLQARVAETASETISQQFADQQKQWQDEVKADAQLGGANFQKTLGEISKLVEQYGDDDLVQVMAATGAGNNIAVIRFLNKVAGVVNEGAPATGGPTQQEASVAQRLYPSMNKG